MTVDLGSILGAPGMGTSLTGTGEANPFGGPIFGMNDPNGPQGPQAKITPPGFRLPTGMPTLDKGPAITGGTSSDPKLPPAPGSATANVPPPPVLPPPTGSAPPDAFTQPTPPVYEAPDLQTPEYHKPKSGLEYLAAGLSLLFPGSTIGKFAAGFSGGLDTGANQAYARDVDKTKTANESATAQAQAQYENEKNQYNADLDAVSRGIDPKTNKPIPLPPDIAAMAKAAMDPNAPYAKVLMAQRALANFYSGVGATTLVKQYEDDAKETVAAMRQKASDDLRWKIHADTEVNADKRSQNTIDAENQREQSREYYRENFPSADARLRSAGGKGLSPDPKAASKLRVSFYGDLQAQTKSGADMLQLINAQSPAKQAQDAKDGGFASVDAMKAALQTRPAAIPKEWVPTLGNMFSTIDNSKDPTATAQQLSDHLEQVGVAKHLPGVESTSISAMKKLLFQRAELNATQKGAWGALAQPAGGGSDGTGYPMYPGN